MRLPTLVIVAIVIWCAAGCSPNKRVDDELKVHRKELDNQGQVIAKLQKENDEARQNSKQLAQLDGLMKRVDAMDGISNSKQVVDTWEVYPRLDPQKDHLRFVIKLESNGKGKTLGAFVFRDPNGPKQEKDPKKIEEDLWPY